MKCPVDGENLVITERSGVEIDYCPKCRGVWLDRGELDKILDRAADAGPTRPAQEERRPDRRETQDRDDDRDRRDYERRKDRDDEDDKYRGGRRYDDDDHYRGKPKRRESFLSDIFDIF